MSYIVEQNVKGHIYLYKVESHIIFVAENRIIK
jgi:hypothetical protein